MTLSIMEMKALKQRRKRRDKQRHKPVHCNACGWKWIPKVDDPVTCPRCKSYRWKAQTTTLKDIVQKEEQQKLCDPEPLREIL